jgi:hypothetical protein
VVALAGCEAGHRLPKLPISQEAHDGGIVLAFDTQGDGKAHYWQRQDAQGRIVSLQYDDNGDGRPDATVDLDRVSSSRVPHLILALDGCPYECIEQTYKDGGFRAFYPPVRLISCFPAMTDLALSQIWQCGPARFYEALYFERKTKSYNSGNRSYLRAENSPWVAKMAYRCSFWWDANAYLNPQSVFDHEFRGVSQTFRRVREGTAAAYTVGTAGLGTRGGRPAMLKYLERFDRLCRQILYERRGQVKMTLLADHGQGMKPCTRVSFKDYLAQHGFNLRDHLSSSRDVVTVEYGLVTYAAFFTNSPAELVEVLRAHPSVELVFYRAGQDVVALDRNSRATVTQAGNGFRYDTTAGDPLELETILAGLRKQGKVSDGNVFDDRALFEATVTHLYPDAVRRAWFAFNGLTQVCPDVIVSLHDTYSHGSAFFDVMIGGAQSTHGSIERLSTTSFVLTMRGRLAPALRLEEVLPALEEAKPASPTIAASGG